MMGPGVAAVSFDPMGKAKRAHHPPIAINQPVAHHPATINFPRWARAKPFAHHPHSLKEDEVAIVAAIVEMVVMPWLEREISTRHGERLANL
jgi:hypothetical protein